MKQLFYILIISIALVPLHVQAQAMAGLEGDAIVSTDEATPSHPNVIADMSEMVTIHQDSAITSLLESKITGKERKAVEVEGFRVQVYSSNNSKTGKTGAFDKSAKLEEAGLLDAVYVQYQQPFWKVRVGDYTNREDANLMMAEILRIFPEWKGSTYVVKEMVTIMR